MKNDNNFICYFNMYIDSKINNETDLIDTLKPETEIERLIVSDKEFLDGALWGESREGHPEGQVALHILGVLNNIDKYSISHNREKLRLVALVHDTFKHKVDQTKPKIGDNHHAVIARKFLEKYCSNKETLLIAELHEEAFNAWQKGNRDNKWNIAEDRALKLINKLGKNLNFYLIFFKCDNETGNKKQDCLYWFEKNIN